MDESEIDENEMDIEQQREELLRKIDIGIGQLDRGEGIVVPLEKLHEFFENIKREGMVELERRRKSQSNENQNK
jgi:hypothetical protein